MVFQSDGSTSRIEIATQSQIELVGVPVRVLTFFQIRDPGSAPSRANANDIREFAVGSFPADLGIEALETKRAAIDDRAALPQLGAKGLEQRSQLTMSLSSTDQPGAQIIQLHDEFALPDGRSGFAQDPSGSLQNSWQPLAAPILSRCSKFPPSLAAFSWVSALAAAR